ncbi:hypothetical protein LTR78_009162 [Recurvomyces mirabilis]|uniref:Uncharacterized protein n=1 Tax=Recurvomyces mirabilis TaxID=574656 RepID=A0AAE0WGL7_9PEZI|nr:hypothetical protein LTR78_009162 [Recurvomyces mirabilis]KAK5155678.1 hypothetical protein LTS14_005939 [Recurvomyces mirabilis]
MDDFGDGLELVYPGTGVADPTTTPTSERATRRQQSRHEMCFLDLPRELRDLTYAQALKKDRAVRIGFKYDCLYTEAYAQRQEEQRKARIKARTKSPHQGIYQASTSPDDVLLVRWMRWKEQLPAMAFASPLLKEEVLTAYYRLNSFKFHLRNFVDKRLCAEWIHNKAVLLKDLNHVDLYGTHVGPVAHGRAGLWERLPRSCLSTKCNCTKVDWFNKYIDTDTGRGLCGQLLPDGLDEHGVAGTLLRICEISEATEQARQAMDTGRETFDNRILWTDQPYKADGICGICAKERPYVVLNAQTGRYRTLQ